MSKKTKEQKYKENMILEKGLFIPNNISVYVKGDFSKISEKKRNAYIKYGISIHDTFFTYCLIKLEYYLETTERSTLKNIFKELKYELERV